ncbi:Mitochondrial folate transporter/carrier [Strongyloides ratti]|uniref:Mitochondrial folate transporter/carrier n=1 Tax=Strongyloides ratti TaxID=34506 RepID=A0A090L399_STRRB|nr:Mitochondrial folate transporter/carrier [Strongyloides ratti]CEF61974.1 Mitochondrial folate transporter/carrier [Strongyloides ratti]
MLSLKGYCKGYENLIAGFSGANDCKSNRPQYGSYYNAIKQIYKSGGMRMFYQGITPSLVGASTAWGLYFHICHRITDKCEHLQINKEIKNFVIAGVSGIGVQCFTNCFWVAKTRLCLQYETEKRQYKGLIDCLYKILKNEGIIGLYKGFVPGMFGTLHGSIQWMVYNFLKASKIAATTPMFPYQVLKTRLQDQHNTEKSLIKLIKTIYRREGLRGFYKGLIAGNVKQLPTAIVTFLTYENVKYILQ